MTKRVWMVMLVVLMMAASVQAAQVGERITHAADCGVCNLWTEVGAVSESRNGGLGSNDTEHMVCGHYSLKVARGYGEDFEEAEDWLSPLGHIGNIGNTHGLRRDNRIHRLFEMESEVMPREQIEDGYSSLVALINAIRAELSAMQGASVEDQIQRAYVVMQNDGYAFRAQPNPSFSDNLVRKELDCDTSSFVILTLADELRPYDAQWNNVGLVNLPDHAFISFIGEGREEPVYFDYGRSYSKEFYILAYRLPADRVDALFEPLMGEDIHANFYFVMGLLYDMLKDYEVAIEYYSRAVQIDAKLVVAHLNLGVCYTSLGDFERAIESFDRVLGIHPEYPQAYNNKGMVFYFMGAYEESIDLYSRAIAMDRDYAEPYLNRGLSRYAVQDYHGAIADYDRRIELRPLYSNTYYARGLAHFVIEDYVDAIEDFNKTLELNPTHVHSYYYRGLSNHYLGRNQEALTDLYRVRESGYTFADEGISFLESLLTE